MTEERILDLLEQYTHIYILGDIPYAEMKPYYMRFMEECYHRNVRLDIEVEEAFISTVLSHFTNYSHDALLSLQQRKERNRMYRLIG